MGDTRGRAALFAVCGMTALLMIGGCSSGEGSDPSPQPSGSATASATTSPSAPPAATATAAPTAPATATAAPAPTTATTTVAPPPAFTQAPPLPAEQSAASETFAACAQRYQERIQNVTLGGAVTPVLLEEWANAYEAASASAAEGDPAAAAAACRELQAKMDTVLR